MSKAFANHRSGRRAAARSLALAALGSLWWSTLPAAAAAWPERPIRLISPYGAGGVADPVARSLAEALTKDLGQSVVVENRPGANTMVGIGLVANGPTDGYSMVLVTGAMLSNTYLYNRMPYPPENVRTIAVLYEGPYVYVINPRIPARNLQEFAAWAKAAPKPPSYASVAPGNNLSLVPEIFAEEAGIRLHEVSYAGKSGEALMAVMSGDVDLMVTLAAHAAPQISAGKLRALAVTTEQRMDTLPDVPTVTESGYPRTTGTATWGGIAVHSRTSPEVVEKLRAAIDRAISDEAFRKRFAPLGLLVQAPRTLPEVERYVETDRQRWGSVIQRLGLKLD